MDGLETYFAMGGYAGASAAVVGEYCYVATFAEQILAVNWKKGETVWSYQHESRHFPFLASPAVTRRSPSASPQPRRAPSIR